MTKMPGHNNDASNYEKMKHKMQAEFASRGMEGIAAEWGLEEDEACLQVTFAGRRYMIDKETGAVLYMDGDELKEADFNVAMTLYDILSRRKQYASGRLVSIGALSSVHSASVLADRQFRRSAQRYDGRERELAAACEALGGSPFGKGDVGYRLPVFLDLDVAVQFWSADDEFPAQLTLLCDSNTLSFMHFETLMYMLGHITGRLAGLMEAPCGSRQANVHKPLITYESDID